MNGGKQVKEYSDRRVALGNGKEGRARPNTHGAMKRAVWCCRNMRL